MKPNPSELPCVLVPFRHRLGLSAAAAVFVTLGDPHSLAGQTLPLRRLTLAGVRARRTSRRNTPCSRTAVRPVARHSVRERLKWASFILQSGQKLAVHNCSNPVESPLLTPFLYVIAVQNPPRSPLAPSRFRRGCPSTSLAHFSRGVPCTSEVSRSSISSTSSVCRFGPGLTAVIARHVARHLQVGSCVPHSTSRQPSITVCC